MGDEQRTAGGVRRFEKEIGQALQDCQSASRICTPEHTCRTGRVDAVSVTAWDAGLSLATQLLRRPKRAERHVGCVVLAHEVDEVILELARMGVRQLVGQINVSVPDRFQHLTMFVG